MKLVNKPNFISKTLCMILSATLAAPSYLFADEIDDTRKRLENHYERVLPIVDRAAKRSHEIAMGKLLFKLREATSLASRSYLAFAEDWISNPKRQMTSMCIGNLSAFDEQVFSKLMEEEAGIDPQNLQNFRKDTYSAFDLITMTEASNEVLYNYTVCLPEVNRAERALSTIKDLQQRPVKICEENSFNQIPYANILELVKFPVETLNKLDAPNFFDFFPGISVVWTNAIKCTGKDTGGINCNGTEFKDLKDFLSPAGLGVATTLGLLMLHQFGVINLAGSASVGTAAAGSAISSSAAASASAIGSAVAAAAVVLVSLIVMGWNYFKMKRKTKSLNRFIEKKEKELQNLFSKGFIKPAEFEALKKPVCELKEGAIRSEIQRLAQAINADKHLLALSQFKTRSQEILQWYNELFIWASTPNEAGTSFLDETTRLHIENIQRSFRQDILESQAVKHTASIKSRVNSLQSSISLYGKCSSSTQDVSKSRRELRRLVRKFNSNCKAKAELFSLETPKLELDNGASVVCSYSGLKRASQLKIENAEEYAAKITLLSENNESLAEIHNFNSDNLVAGKSVQIKCQDPTGVSSFGTTEQTVLPPGVYHLTPIRNTRGLNRELTNQVRDRFEQTAKLVRKKIIRCGRKLLSDSSFSIPQIEHSCSVSGGNLF